MAMKLIIGGALGRMGQELEKTAREEGWEVVCGVDVAYTGQAAQHDMVTGFEQVKADADVLVDFSRPDALPELLALLRARKLPAVLCATGYTDEELREIQAVSTQVPILRSANMSLGVSVMQELVAMAARTLEGFDIEIVEKHHNQKADSPSGTALMLYEAARGSIGPEAQPVFGRYGRTQKRAPGEIGIHAVRGGSVTGEHEVGFYGPGEQVLITHRAESRALFARGALRAARYVADKPPALYSMRDVVREMLGL